MSGSFLGDAFGGRGGNNTPGWPMSNILEGLEQLRSQFEQKAGSMPRMNKGDVRSAVLSLLIEQPMHGYQIIREIQDPPLRSSISRMIWYPCMGCSSSSDSTAERTSPLFMRGVEPAFCSNCVRSCSSPSRMLDMGQPGVLEPPRPPNASPRNEPLMTTSFARTRSESAIQNDISLRRHEVRSSGDSQYQFTACE